MTEVLGIDIGGTGIKVGTVDTERGVLVLGRRRAPTPVPAKPLAVAEIVAQLAGHWRGRVGVGFPGVVRSGVIATAANLDPAWIGEDASALLGDRIAAAGVAVVNDADAAGLAEMRFGAGAGRRGVVVMLTLGTGIGTAVFNDGVLLPNTEFGHLIMGDREAEDLASGRVKVEEELTWEHWAEHLLEFLGELERLFNPDLFILGGGISAEFRTYCERLELTTGVVPAAMGNDAGIVGAALYAVDGLESPGARSGGGTP